MKILILTNLFPPHFIGGFEIRCGQVAHALAKRGHDVTVLTSIHGVDGPTVEEGDVLVERRLNLSPVFGGPFTVNRWDRLRTSKKNFAIAMKTIDRVRPDLVFVWSQARLTLGAVRAVQKRGVPIAWTFGDPNISQYLPANFRKRPISFAHYLFDNWLFPDTTLKGLDFRYSNCLSEFLKVRMLNNGVPIQDCRVIYRGIPLKRFPCKANVGSIQDPARILYVGQLHSHKGVHTLIKAAHELMRSGGINVDVSIAGTGHEKYLSRLRKKADSGPANVNFLGNIAQSDLGKVYREHDVFVFPSTNAQQEGFGATHLEAMASGVPVVGTACGGQAELFEDGINAVTFEPENARDLAEKLSLVIRDDQFRCRLATTARKMVEEKFSIETYIDSMDRFLLEAARDGGNSQR